MMPVGIPLQNIKVKILNNELVVSGPVLSPGYLNSKDDKDIFFKDKKNFWYRTKDQVEIYKKKYFIKGRVDSVVKIQGYRIDLGDVEKNLRGFKNIDDALVYLKSINNKKILCCVIKSRYNLKKIELIKKLSNKVPNYMVPQRFKVYKTFPLNRSGKIDRNKIMI